jgi:hypothetical protein
MPDTVASVKALQSALNKFTSKYLSGVTPLIVDGKKGRATNTRVKTAKYYLGYGSDRDAKTTRVFLQRLRSPHKRSLFAKGMYSTAFIRRARQRARHVSESVKANLSPGVTTYDGVPVAKCAVPILQWCRTHGWQGKLVSGYRSPAYSDSLCRRMCGAPKCPGLCAGRDSNHSGNSPARFALDVSDYTRFAQVVAKCPVSPRVFNDLPRDRVHFSPNGH